MGRPVGYILNRTLEKHKKIDELYAQGKLAKEIADTLHMTRQSVGKYFKEKGYHLQKRIRQLNEHIFDVIDTEEKAYWLGFLCADCALECGNGNSKRRYNVELALSDREHVEKFAEFLESDAPVKEKIVKLGDKEHKAYRFFAASKHLAETLKEHFGEIHKRDRINLPYVDPKLRRHMLRGFFDGDGTLILQPRLSLEVSSNVNLILDFSKILHIESRVREVSIKQSNVRCYGKIAVEILNYFYSDANVYLDRKYTRYAHYFGNE